MLIFNEALSGDAVDEVSSGDMPVKAQQLSNELVHYLTDVDAQMPTGVATGQLVPLPSIVHYEVNGAGAFTSVAAGTARLTSAQEPPTKNEVGP